MEVRVDEFQRDRATRGDRREGISGLLTIHASRADGERGRSRRLGKREASDHLKLNKRFEAIRRNVAKAVEVRPSFTHSYSTVSLFCLYLFTLFRFISVCIQEVLT